MKLHSQSSALDWGELKGKKKWRKPLFSMEEPTAPATQMAFAQKGNLPVPILKRHNQVLARSH